MSYVIGSGWWCADKSEDNRDFLHGDDVIRGKDFHKLWYASVDRFTSPDKIIIVDSCSPIRPDINRDDPRMEFVSLSLNAGHSTCHAGKYCGYVRAILLGMEYTLQCGVDYYVYVEQDALLFGEGIIEHCLSHMKKPYMFGAGEGTPQKTQQSLFIIRQDGIREFMRRLHHMKERDSEICPEVKFHIVCSKGPVRLLAEVYKHVDESALFKWLDWQFFKYLKDYDELPIGYGRSRPVNFDDEIFYFQQGEREYLDEYLRKTKFNWP